MSSFQVYEGKTLRGYPLTIIKIGCLTITRNGGLDVWLVEKNGFVFLLSFWAVNMWKYKRLRFTKKDKYICLGLRGIEIEAAFLGELDECK